METLLQQFKSNKGYLKTNRLSRSSRYELDKLIHAGEVYRVKHGLYAYKGYLGEDETTLVAEMIPNGVFCLFTAWQQYDLTTTVSPEFHVASHRNTKITLPEYPPVAVYYWSDKIYHLGITEIKKENKTLKFYDKERSVCDAVKFRNKIGEDIMQEVIKSYVRQKQKNIDQLMQYAKILRVEKIMTPYLKSLL